MSERATLLSSRTRHRARALRVLRRAGLPLRARSPRLPQGDGRRASRPVPAGSGCRGRRGAAPGGGRRRGGGTGGQSAPQDLGAWLHIGEDGQISVYTGKAEVGQNIRTSLSQAVAEELHAPVESIQMVMADTQLTPYDMGTFGSLSTPRMSPQLRRAAAAAREMLIDLAAETWKVDRSDLTAADGSIVRAEDQGEAPLRQAHPRQKAHEDGLQPGPDDARR